MTEIYSLCCGSFPDAWIESPTFFKKAYIEVIEEPTMVASISGLVGWLSISTDLERLIPSISGLVCRPIWRGSKLRPPFIWKGSKLSSGPPSFERGARDARPEISTDLNLDILLGLPAWYDQLFHWLLLETPTMRDVISTSDSSHSWEIELWFFQPEISLLRGDFETRESDIHYICHYGRSISMSLESSHTRWDASYIRTRPEICEWLLLYMSFRPVIPVILYIRNYVIHWWLRDQR